MPCGTALVFLGYFVGDWAELAGAVVLTAGMWLVGWLTWTQVRRGVTDRPTRALLGVSAVTLAATMVLALSWALGEATGLPHPSVEWMAATHGVCNAAGFALCGVAAWHRLRIRPL
ncbi:YndJ family transporter [Sphaerisporangium sp. NPDC088356]|uniref:YndJ family transporter n=1 Tax=Sphaerisporangium sp. NPDC088356 TaxID=3154871 RepID=UPI00342E5EE6